MQNLKKGIKKYQNGGESKPDKIKKDKIKQDPPYKFKDSVAKDSAAYYKKELVNLLKTNNKKDLTKPIDNYFRQFNKGKAGYDKLGFKIIKKTKNK